MAVFWIFFFLVCFLLVDFWSLSLGNFLQIFSKPYISFYNEVWKMTRVTGISKHLVGDDHVWPSPWVDLPLSYSWGVSSVSTFRSFPGPVTFCGEYLSAILRIKFLVPLLWWRQGAHGFQSSGCIWSLDSQVWCITCLLQLCLVTPCPEASS